jgi:hypothetical protein
MKKPTPPTSNQQSPQQIQNSGGEQASSIDVFSMPIQPASNFFDLIEQTDDVYIDDALIDSRHSGVSAASVPDGFAKTCVNCANYWALETLAPVKNTKEDGTPFTRKEEYCIFSDKLFTLSEREVYSCTRFTAKKS